jgi:hypothetical protein
MLSLTKKGYGKKYMTSLQLILKVSQKLLPTLSLYVMWKFFWLSIDNCLIPLVEMMHSLNVILMLVVRCIH